MTDKVQKIREEVERLMYGFNLEADIASCENAEVEKIADIKYQLCKKILEYIDSMQEESISEDFKIALEKKVREAQDWTYIEEEGGECPLNEEFGAYDLEEFARWGANWQKEQMMAKAFDFTQEHNIACILASECLRNHGWFNRERDFNDLFRHLSCVDKLFEGKFCGKTKVIVIKED